MKTKRTILIIIFLFILFLNSKSQENKLGLGVNYGYQYLKMEDFNTFIINHPALAYIEKIFFNPASKENNIIEIKKGCQYFSTSLIYKPFSKINGYMIGQFDYIQTNKGSNELILTEAIYGATGTTYKEYSYKFEYQPSSYIFSLIPTYEYNFNEKININGGVGISYYLVNLTEKQINLIDKYPHSENKDKYKGNQFGFQISTGFEYYIFKRFSCNLNLLYKYAKIKQLKNKDINSIPAEFPVELDFSGLNVNVGLRYDILSERKRHKFKKIFLSH